jgi:hypothetical protein
MNSILKHIILIITLIFIFCIPINILLFLGDKSNINTCLKIDELYCIPSVIKNFLLITLLTIVKKPFFLLIFIIIYLMFFYTYIKIYNTNLKKVLIFILISSIFAFSYYLAKNSSNLSQIFHTPSYLILLCFIGVLYWFLFNYLLSKLFKA